MRTIEEVDIKALKQRIKGNETATHQVRVQCQGRSEILRALWTWTSSRPIIPAPLLGDRHPGNTNAIPTTAKAPVQKRRLVNGMVTCACLPNPPKNRAPASAAPLVVEYDVQSMG